MRSDTARKRSDTVVIVLVTCPNPVVGRRLARAVVQRKLAACVNLLPGIESVYTWKGRLERSRETLMLIKTTKSRYEPLRRLLVSMHPYELPEVIAIRVSDGHPAYLRWVASETSRR